MLLRIAWFYAIFAGAPWTPLELNSAAFGMAQDPAKQEAPKCLPEYELKAGFLFQFAKYVTWPARTFTDDKAPIVIGIVGDDPFGEHLNRALKDKTLKGRAFTILHFPRAEDIKLCHILFVPRSEGPRAQAILKAVASMPALTIGEDPAFARNGGSIGIIVQEEKARLEINLDVARLAGLSIDAKLLKVATVLKKAR